MEKKLMVLMLRRVMGHVVSAAFLIGLLTYGLALLASLTYTGLTLIGIPFNMHAITSRGSLMPFTGIVPLSISYALNQLGVRNIPIAVALALLDYKHVVMVLGFSNITGSACYTGSIVGVRPGLHLLTSYIRKVTVPVLVIVKGNEPYLVCSMNLTEALSNTGYGSVTMILIPSKYWGRALWFIRHGINVTIVNKLNQSVDIQYSYLGLSYLVNYGLLKPGVSEINLPLNYYIVYAIINETPVPVGEVPKDLNITVKPLLKPITLLKSTTCMLTINAPQGSNIVVSNNRGMSIILNAEEQLNLTLPCGSYLLTAYKGGEYSTVTINLTKPVVVNLTLTSFSGEVTGIESNYAEYARAYFRGITAVYVSFIVIAIVAVGLTLAGLLGLASMVKMIAWAISPILTSLSYLASIDYMRRVELIFMALMLLIMSTIASFTFMIINNAHVILIVRQPLVINPSIIIVVAGVVIMGVWLMLRESMEA
ncbi:hypothetical protein [Caldivirga sp.]|uniref:hypothetical protein n=1 Tax=Caldivirga sp. TaxID=2080243 RepID=UPI003D0A34F1